MQFGNDYSSSHISQPVTAEQLRVAEAQRREASARLFAQESRLAQAFLGQKQNERLICSLEARQRLSIRLNRFQKNVSESISFLGATIIATTLGGAIGIVIGVLSDASFSVGLLLTLIGSIGIGVLVLAFSNWKPEITAGENRLEIARKGLQTIYLIRRSLEADTIDAKREALAADNYYAKVLAVFNSRKNQILSSKWELMTAIDFEQFLSKVFQELGHAVEMTGQSGDEGVDLIVSKVSRRIAIQAKGYPASTVGSKAVQEAYTGMACRKCCGCAVVTNSRFTRQAISMAGKLNCRLLDRDDIPRLIRGEIDL